MDRIVAMKCYGFDWLLRFGLTEEQAADRLLAHGVDWALLQNMRDPLPSSDVEQQPPRGHDEVRFRALLRERGIRVYESTAVYFQPAHFDARPELRPVGADGRTMERVGWYVGLCPSDRAYLAERAALMREVVSALEPDGVFLSFLRFPGFWEAWTAGTRRADVPEYCFCDRCLARFQEETGHSLPAGGAPAAAPLLQSELRAAWTDWKCGVIAEAARTLRAAARETRPGVEALLNGIPFGPHDLGDVTREVLGQDIELITEDVEDAELMVYHQILAESPGDWIPRLIRDVRPRAHGRLFGCIQTAAAYADGVRLGSRRRPDLPVEDVEEALGALAASSADGVIVYHWSDVLADDAHGGRIARALRAYKDGTLPEHAA